MSEFQTTIDTRLHSYAKIYHLGHRYLNDLLKGLVLVEEKVDGSQFSFGRRGSVGGLPEWYKERLALSQFENKGE